MSSFRQLMMKDKGGKQLETMYLTKNGSPTIVDGIASGFSDSDYLYFPIALNKPFEFKIKFMIASDSYVSIGQMYGVFGHYNMYGIMSLGVRTNGSGITTAQMLSTNNSSWNIMESNGTTVLSKGQWYYFKLSFSGTQYKVEISSDDSTYSQEGISDRTTFINNGNTLNVCLGKGRQSDWSFSVGSIDLNESRFTLDGVKYKFEIA